FVEVVPFVAVAVPCGLACVPAVEPVPETEPDCVVPVPVSCDEVRVFSLLLLQPNTNAAASARPYADFMCCLLKGFHGAFNWGAAPKTPGSPRLLRRGRHRAAATEASHPSGRSRRGHARRRCARTLSELPE